MDWPAIECGGWRQTVDWLAQHVEQASKDRWTHRDVNAAARSLNSQAASQAVCIAQRDSANDSPGQELLDLQDQDSRPIHNQ
jgi:hypothetical protein